MFSLAGFATAQTVRPPVVFVRGYDFNWLLGGFCNPSDPSGTFGSLPSQIQSDGAMVYGFDNCAAAGMKNVPIEMLGALFGQFLATIPAPQVDIVAHSMGGLIVRAYMAGLQPAPASSTPPQDPRIRKIVFIATPHFGTGLANLFGSDAEVTDMAMGSGFLYNLARWNQGVDDLRGIDSLAIVGNSGPTGTDDGLVSLNSASLVSFGRPFLRTRVLPYCHTGILAILGACTGGSIAEAPETSTMVRSFLAGTNDWSTVGTTIVAGTGATGGILFTARDATDAAYNISSVVYDAAGSSLSRGALAYYKDLVSPATYAMKAQTTAGVAQGSIAIQPAQFVAALVKVPPAINAIIPSAGLSDARVVAPGSLVSFYGSGLAASSAQFTNLPFPTQLADTTITSGSTALPLLAVSNGQVNAYVPPSLSGFLNVTIKNSLGQHTTTLLVAPAVPALFSLNNSGSGPASALHASGVVVGATNPATAGEYISLYATGLGGTTASSGLDVAVLTPQVTVGGAPAMVTFAGRAPGFVGLDQINIQIPAGITGAAVPVVASSGGRTSNTVTLAIQ
jgi:uncharacterized protein (TIGR03437 family)